MSTLIIACRYSSLSLRRAWIEMRTTVLKFVLFIVALLTESVD